MRQLAKIGVVVWNSLMAIWAASALWSSTTRDCASDSCETGRAAGLVLAWTVIIVVAAAGNVILGIAWLVSKPEAPSASVMTERWLPDPTGRHEFRFWDGERWTSHVGTDGVRSTDPI